MNRAVFESFGTWWSADDTANGRRRKNAMVTMMSLTGRERGTLYSDECMIEGGLLTADDGTS